VCGNVHVETSNNNSSIHLNKGVEVLLVRKMLGDVFISKLSGVKLWPLKFHYYSLSALSLRSDQAWLLVALAGALSGISNLHDFWHTDVLYCCDILSSELFLYALSQYWREEQVLHLIFVLLYADCLERSVTDSSLGVSLHLLQRNVTLNNILL
jgi:hypothetical protein